MTLSLQRMTSKITLLDDIAPGRIKWIIRVRVISIWKIPNFKYPLETSSLELLLLDEKLTKIHATIKRSLITQFENLVEEGSSYLFENFVVGKNDTKLRTTRHKFKLNFMGNTKCESSEADNIPTHSFSFQSFKLILDGMDDAFLIDIIGHVVEKDEMKELVKNGKTNKLIEFVLEDLESNKLTCTLWGDYAEKMHQYLMNNDSGVPIIVILHQCKLKTFNGQVGISNAYHGTKLMINPKLKEDREYKDRLQSGNHSFTQAVSQMSSHSSLSLTDDLLQTQRMSILDILEAAEECSCVVLANVIDIETDWGWNYQSCKNCLKKVEAVGDTYYCGKCAKKVTAIPRYKLHIQVIDDTGSATFVVFDRLLTQYLGKSAKELLESIEKDNDSVNYPKEFEALLGKEMLFKIDITQGNIDQKWQHYVVKKMTDAKDLIKDFKKQHSSPHFGTTICIEVDGNTKVGSENGDCPIKDGLSQKKAIDVEDEMAQTPIIKKVEKRSVDPSMSGSQTSTAKLQKLMEVKKEPLY